jgi:hypothetical protein
VIGKRDHAVETLGASPVAFRAVVGFDLEQGLALLGSLLLPPGMQGVDDEVADFGGASEGQVQRADVLVDQTERGLCRLTIHVVLGALDVTTGPAALRVLADLDHGIAVDAQLLDVSALAALVFGPEIVEDGFGPPRAPGAMFHGPRRLERPSVLTMPRIPSGGFE